MEAKKSFQIKSLYAHNVMGERDAERVWGRLKEAIYEIFNSNASALSFEELYRNAYNLVLNKYGKLLYDGVSTEVTNHLKKVGDEVSKVTDSSLLEVLCARWDYHTVTMNMIRDILMYMDRTFVSTSHKTPVYDLGLVIFREEVARHPKVQKRLLLQLLQNIERERNGELIQRDLMRKTLNMLVELGVYTRDVYQQDFEAEFLRASQQFYSVEGLENVTKDTCAEYLVKAEKRLFEEKARSQHYLDDSTEPKLMKLVEKELIEHHASTLVQSKTGAAFMYENDRLDDLSRLFKLFSRVPSTLDDVRRSLADFIKADGEELIKRDEDDRSALKFVRALLQRREKYETIVKVAFKNEKEFLKTLKESFEHIVNMNNKVPHFLSLYVDELMKERAKVKGQVEENLDETLDKVIVIFRHLQDKDIFENYYKRLLAKRLLLKKRSFDSEFSFESEERFISKLKAECGQQFTSKLEAMIKDMKMSAVLMTDYRAQVKLKSLIELDVNVLTMGSWPDTGDQTCILPKHIEALCDSFKAFYLSIHEGRRLTWQTNLGNAEVKMMFKTPHYTLVVSTYQMLVLLLYNEKESWTFQEISNRTQIPEQELKRHLISLAAPKFKLLNKEPKGKTIQSDHQFSVNTGFSSKVYRIRIPLISARAPQTKQQNEEEDVPKQVEDDRKHLIEAAVVRIMKARKQLTNSLLVAEVVKQLEHRFRPSPQQIKKRIEALIEREYLERDEKDRRVYKYKA